MKAQRYLLIEGSRATVIAAALLAVSACGGPSPVEPPLITGCNPTTTPCPPDNGAGRGRQ